MRLYPPIGGLSVALMVILLGNGKLWALEEHNNDSDMSEAFQFTSSLNCSTAVHWRPFKPSDLQDISWEEYIKSVYGTSVDINPIELDMVYKHGAIEMITSGGTSSTIKPKRTKNAIQDTYTQNFASSFLHLPIQSHGWAEVTRMSGRCLSKAVGQPWVEGLSHGFPFWTSYDPSKPKVPYGCWFYVSRGSGVFVNVKKTLFIPNRELAPDILRVSNDSIQRENDRDFCWYAMAMGYDSFQMVQRVGGTENIELAICTGRCGTIPLTSSCPPLPLRTGNNASLPCKCDPSRSLINCGGDVSPRDACSFVAPPSSRSKSCALQRDEYPPRHFNFTIAFTAGLQRFMDHLRQWTATVKHLRKQGPLLFLDVGTFPLSPLSTTNHSPSAFSDALKRLGYNAVAVGRRGRHDLAFLPERIPHPSINLINFTTSAVVRVSPGVFVGLIGYTVTEVFNVTRVSRRIIDEALCLRKRVSVVLLLTHGGFPEDDLIARKTKGYVDAVLAGDPLVSSSCDGQWHNLDNDTVVVPLGHHGMQYGLLRVMGSDEGIAIASTILDIVPSYGASQTMKVIDIIS